MRPTSTCVTFVFSIAVAGLIGCQDPQDRPATLVVPDQSEITLQKPEGRSFNCLDDYLAYLKEASAADSAYYEEVSPGIYELRAGAPLAVETPTETFTRKQLQQKYEFSC